MKPEEFSHYVESQLKQGIPRGALVNNLLAGGWSQQQIDAAFAEHDKRLHTELTHKSSHHPYLVRDIIWWTIFLIVALSAFFFFMGDPEMGM